MEWRQGLSHTIDNEVEIHVKFSSSSEAAPSPVLPAVLARKVVDPQGRHVGHVDPVLILVPEADPGGRVRARRDPQDDCVR